MTASIIAFFNNKGGVGKTSLVYHLGWTMARQGMRVVAADLDPQANLTSIFLDEETLEPLWRPDGVDAGQGRTIFGGLEPLIRGVGGVVPVKAVPIIDGLSLLPGDLALSGFESELSNQWPQCLDGHERVPCRFGILAYLDHGRRSRACPRCPGRRRSEPWRDQPGGDGCR